MRGWRRIVWNIAIAAGLAAYPILAYFVAAAPPPAGTGTVALAVAPLVVVVALVGWRTPHRLLTLTLCVATCALLWVCAGAIGQHLGLVYFIQNICTSAALALLFGRSLVAGREPLCSRFAAMVRGPLQPPVARYTRQVTVAWTIFFAAMIVASTLLFLLSPIGVWSAFANLLTIPLVALMFIVEYAVRRRVLPDLPRTNILDALHAYWNSAAAPVPPPRWRRQ